MSKAVILLSGGLDSSTCMAVAKKAGHELYPISFDYEHRHSKELESAQKIAQHYGVKEYLIIKTNMSAIGGSSLTDSNIDVPAGEAKRDSVTTTYVPARNLIFLSYALGYAERLAAEHIYIGVNSVDYSGYPDCRREFIEHFQRLADYSTAASVDKGVKIKIETPLQSLSKAEIIKLGTTLGVPYQLTHSCYQGGEIACGACDSCLLRLAGFKDAGVTDPIAYQEKI